MKLRKIFPAAIPVIVAVLFLAAISNNAYYLTIFVFCGIYVIAVSGLDILFGYSGQISLGHAMFYASGAYTSGILTTKFGVNPWLAILAGLLVTALINLILGFSTSFAVFMVLWAINGWAQSMGAAPCVVGLSRWFGNKERGTFYGLWSSSHNIGEALTFIVTAAIVASLGWQWGFRGAAVLSVICTLTVWNVRAE